MEWLMLEPSQWPLMSGYRRYSKFVKKLIVVNDPAERGIKAIQDFIDASKEIRQDILFSTAEHRKMFPGGSGATKSVPK